MASERYRHYAAECLRVAQQISNPIDKALLVQMAESWLRLAERAAERAAKNDDSAA